MKKLWVPLVVVLVGAFLAGCGSGGATTAPSGSTTAPASGSSAATSAAPSATIPTAGAPKPSATIPIQVPSPSASKYGGTARYVSAAGPGTPLDPWEATGGTIVTMQYAIEPLLREDIGGKLVPRLALSWEINPSADPPNIVFHLRQGVKFSDGSDFNAQAVAWNLQKTKEGAMQAGTSNFWKSFDVIDDYTLRVNFTVWRNTWLRGFSENVAMLSSPTAFNKNGLDYVRLNMVGTGPFLQTSYLRDVGFTGKKNPEYWDKGYPYLDGVSHLYVADQLTREALFKSGGAELMDIGPSQAAQFQSSEFKVISQLGGTSALIPDSLNSNSPWSNPLVRQAAEYAIDKVGLARSFGYGYTAASYQMPSTANPAYDPNFRGARVYDLAKSRQLLIQAGYSNGFKSTIIDCQPGSQDARNIVTSIQANLAAVGIVCDLQFPEAAQAQTLLSGTWNNALLYTPIIEWANPNTQLNFFFGAPTSSWFKSMKKPDGWNEAVAASVTSPTVDVALAQKCYRMLYDDCTLICLNYGTTLWVERMSLQDSGHGTRGNVSYWNPQYAWLSK